ADEEAAASAAAQIGGEAAVAIERASLLPEASLPNAGPARSLTLVAPPSRAPFYAACCGQGRAGALFALTPGVVPSAITAVPLQGVVGLWALHKQAADGSSDKPAAEGSSDKQTADDSSDKQAADEQLPNHDYLLMSMAGGTTKVLATGDEMHEVTDELDFAADTGTLAVGACGGRLLQVCAAGARALREESAEADFSAAEVATQMGNRGGSEALFAEADIRPWGVLLRLSTGACAFLRPCAERGALEVDRSTEALEALQATSDPVQACCLFEDARGALDAWLGQDVDASEVEK
ncbi:hypothetical protein H632_c3986p0, partial [Helicosporidium sp. ATCC 50920]